MQRPLTPISNPKMKIFHGTGWSSDNVLWLVFVWGGARFETRTGHQLSWGFYTRNYWVFWFCPSSGILKHQRTKRFENWIYFGPQVRRKTPNLLRVCPTHLRMETDTISETLCSVFFLEYRTMDKAQKLNNSKCYHRQNSLETTWGFYSLLDIVRTNSGMVPPLGHDKYFPNLVPIHSSII
jgi:hypothetical protein